MALSQFGWYARDRWQVNRKLTVNIGLRYELPTVPYTINGNATTLNPEQTALIPSNPPVPGFRFINPNHNDWAPQLFGMESEFCAWLARHLAIKHDRIYRQTLPGQNLPQCGTAICLRSLEPGR